MTPRPNLVLGLVEETHVRFSTKRQIGAALGVTGVNISLSAVHVASHNGTA